MFVFLLVMNNGDELLEDCVASAFLGIFCAEDSLIDILDYNVV